METIGIASAKVGRVRDWHRPHNEDCPHNMSPASDCQCKREVNRKPYTVRRVHDPEAERVHDVVCEVHPNGLLVLRRPRHKARYSITLGALYERLELNEAMKAAREARKARKQRRAK